MAEPHEERDAVPEARSFRLAWLPWLALGWILLLLLATLAELGDWDDLRLALDFQRHFR